MKWREEPGGPVIRTPITGVLVARVNWTGSFWRGTVFGAKGSSSLTCFAMLEAMTWCEMELRT